MPVAAAPTRQRRSTASTHGRPARGGWRCPSVHRAGRGGCPPPAGNAVKRLEHPQRSGEGYRRLTNAMTLHDAERAGWVGKFDAVVVHLYSLVARHDGGGGDGGGGGAAVADGKDGDHGPSKIVLDPDSNGHNDRTSDGEDNKGEVGNGAQECCNDDASNDQAMAAMDVNRDNKGDGLPSNAKLQQQRLLQQRIHAIFLSLDGNAKGGGSATKQMKKKPASKQVRNMLMKSKSMGNARIKQEDRLYIVVVLFRVSANFDRLMSPRIRRPADSSLSRTISGISSQRSLAATLERHPLTCPMTRQQASNSLSPVGIQMKHLMAWKMACRTGHCPHC
jgi:hypothetical protein